MVNNGNYFVIGDGFIFADTGDEIPYFGANLMPHIASQMQYFWVDLCRLFCYFGLFVEDIIVGKQELRLVKIALDGILHRVAALYL